MYLFLLHTRPLLFVVHGHHSPLLIYPPPPNFPSIDRSVVMVIIIGGYIRDHISLMAHYTFFRLPKAKQRRLMDELNHIGGEDGAELARPEWRRKGGGGVDDDDDRI